MNSNDSKVRLYVDELFKDMEKNADINKLMERTISELNDKIWIHMKDGLNYDDAFERAKSDMGNINLLLMEMRMDSKDKKAHSSKNQNTPADTTSKTTSAPNINALMALIPLFYVFVGLVTGSGFWWSVGWIIIPVAAILFYVEGKHRYTPLAVFIFISLGMFFNVWSVAWILIPTTAILTYCTKSTS